MESTPPRETQEAVSAWIDVFVALFLMAARIAPDIFAEIDKKNGSACGYHAK